MLQNWFNLADEALEDAVYDSYSFRSFLHLDFFDEQVPDATTLLKFRRFLEKNKIGEKIFADVKERLEKAGLMMHGGTIVDAAVPSSTQPSSALHAPSRTEPASAIRKCTRRRRAVLLGFFGKAKEIISSFALVDTPN